MNHREQLDDKMSALKDILGARKEGTSMTDALAAAKAEHPAAFGGSEKPVSHEAFSQQGRARLAKLKQAIHEVM